jgi:hypothetical protein
MILMDLFPWKSSSNIFWMASSKDKTFKGPFPLKHFEMLMLFLDKNVACVSYENENEGFGDED